MQRVTTMLDKVRKLHELRQIQANYAEALQQSHQVWKDENAGLIANKNELDTDIVKLTAELKAARVDLYDGEDKSKMFGVGIREETVLYYIHQDAYNWAVEHKLALKLDTKVFEKLAKTGPPIDFVTVEKQPQATIATDLSEWLEDD